MDIERHISKYTAQKLVLTLQRPLGLLWRQWMLTGPLSLVNGDAVSSDLFRLPGDGLSVVPLPVFFLTSCSADFISSRVTPCVERRVSRARFACAFLWVSLSSSLTGGTNDLQMLSSYHFCWRHKVKSIKALGHIKTLLCCNKSRK